MTVFSGFRHETASTVTLKRRLRELEAHDAERSLEHREAASIRCELASRDRAAALARDIAERNT